jgi:hypothetical protein
MPAILQVAPPSPRGSRSIPTWSRQSPVTCTNGRPTASAITRRPRRYRLVPRGRASGGGKEEGNPGRRLTRGPRAWGRRGPSRRGDRTTSPTRAHHVACAVERRRPETRGRLARASSRGRERFRICGLCRVKETRAPRVPSVADALHHNVTAQRPGRSKAKWGYTRCHEASSLANLWQLPPTAPPELHGNEIIGGFDLLHREAP